MICDFSPLSITEQWKTKRNPPIYYERCETVAFLFLPKLFIDIFGFHFSNFKIMDEDQAQTMIALLAEISTKLTNLNDKISGDYDYGTVIGKLDEIKSGISSVESNTSNLS